MSRSPLGARSGAGSAEAAPILCAGHPRDMGLAQGEALREVIREAVVSAGLPSRRSRWPSLRPLVSGPLRGAGPGREFFRHFAHQAERLEGLAQGADLPLDSLLALQLRVGAGDVGGLAFAPFASAPVASASAPFASATLASASLAPSAWIVRESRPVVGFRSLECTLAWLVPAVAGINETGLALLAPLSRSAELATVHGAPPVLLVQDCLARFENVEGALDWCRKRPVEGERTIRLADAAGARGCARFRGRTREIEAAEPGEGGLLRGGLIEGGGYAGGVALDPSPRSLAIEEVGAASGGGSAGLVEVVTAILEFRLQPLPSAGACSD